jgi:hypothetical protein
MSSVGLASLKRCPPAFAKLFFTAAAEYKEYHAEVAFALRGNAKRFWTISMHGNDELVAMFIGDGNEVGTGSIGIAVWPDAESARKYALSAPQDKPNMNCVSLCFLDAADEVPPEEMRLAASSGCTFEPSFAGDTKFFPMLLAENCSRAVTWRDARAVLAALGSVRPLYDLMLRERQVPPLPYPTAYAFASSEVDASVAATDLRGRAVPINVRAWHPSFEFRGEDARYREEDSNRARQRPFTPPAHLRSTVATFGDALDYYRKAVADGGPSWRSNTYGLANALWVIGREDTVREACALVTSLLDDGEPGRVDREGARYFLLDMLLEAGRWQDALALLHRYGDEWSTEWAWTSALLHMRSRGLRSRDQITKTAVDAIASAVRVNPHVYHMLLEDAPMAAWRGQMISVTYTMAGIHCCENDASSYLNVHRVHWKAFGRGADGGLATVRAMVRVAGADAYAEWQRKQASEAARPKLSNVEMQANRDQFLRDRPRSLEEMMSKMKEWKQSGASELPGGMTFGNFAIPAIDKTVCSGCGQVGKKLQACAKCNAVRYCSKACQVAHWPSHRGTCKALALVGKRVELHSLSNEAFNGQRGAVVQWLADKERLQVKLDDGRILAVKLANVRRVEQPTEPVALA